MVRFLIDSSLIAQRHQHGPEDVSSQGIKTLIVPSFILHMSKEIEPHHPKERFVPRHAIQNSFTNWLVPGPPLRLHRSSAAIASAVS